MKIKNFRGEVEKEKKFRIGIQHLKDMKLEQLEKNWSFSALKSQTKLLRSKCELQKQKAWVKSLILDQWSIYPKEHQAKEILFLDQIIFDSHLSIFRTWEKVKEMGYRWENLEESARSLSILIEKYAEQEELNQRRILLWNISIVAIRKKDSK